jgi:hypothetical protein
LFFAGNALEDQKPLSRGAATAQRKTLKAKGLVPGPKTSRLCGVA